jgi:hypothetical protein
MTWIDVLILALCGLWLALNPSSFLRPGERPEDDVVRVARVRGIGVLVMGVAGIYAFLKVMSEWK